jgi:hypothetical protein
MKMLLLKIEIISYLLQLKIFFCPYLKQRYLYGTNLVNMLRTTSFRYRNLLKNIPENG